MMDKDEDIKTLLTFVREKLAAALAKKSSTDDEVNRLKAACAALGGGPMSHRPATPRIGHPKKGVVVRKRRQRRKKLDRNYRRKVIELLGTRKDDQVTPSIVAKAFGISKGAANMRLICMTDEGSLVRKAPGHYGLAPKRSQAAE